jgi:N-acetylmuramoyl-L-alanine amidase
MTLKVGGCAGHGGFGVTPGKRTPDGEYEWNFNDKVWRAFEFTLKQYEGVEVRRFDDATGRTDVPLQTRTNRANAWGADLYVSLHHNANTSRWGAWTGVETFSYGSGQSLKLAQAVHPAIVSAYGLRDRGIKNGRHLHIIRETSMPAVLIEGGFMDSTIDIKKLRDDKALTAAGNGVAHAIAKLYGLKKKAVHAQQKPKEDSDMLEKAIVINSFADFPAAEPLAGRLSAPIYLRATAEGKKVAKELYVVGGTQDKLVADKVVLLSGPNRFETAAAVGNFLK